MIPVVLCTVPDTGNNVHQCVRRVAFDNDSRKCGSVLGSLLSHTNLTTTCRALYTSATLWLLSFLLTLFSLLKMQLTYFVIAITDQCMYWETATHPSPKLTFCPKRQVTVNVRLGEGYVGSFPETYIDPILSWGSGVWFSLPGLSRCSFRGEANVHFV